MTVYTIEPNSQTLHGCFSKNLKPILTINSGDTVHYQTLNSNWKLEEPNSNKQTKKIQRRKGEIDAGHALCGPIEIRDAQPGMTLAIKIEEIIPKSFGETWGGGWESEFHERFGTLEPPGKHLLWKIDSQAKIAKSQYGHTLAIKPFMGILGMPPDEPGFHSTVPPRIWGGNIDCKELVAESTLYLPIPVYGGLFSVGDGHAVQGDGEMSGNAIECPMEVVLTFHLLNNLQLSTPRANTPEGWITFGFHEDLNEACYIAANAMLDFMMEKYNLPRKEAIALAGLVVDLRITQMCNGVRGVHAVLSHEVARELFQ